MKKILVLAESLNINKTSEAISTVNFLNSLDFSVFDVTCLVYEFPQFEEKGYLFVDSHVKIIIINNDFLDHYITKYLRLKNFFSKYFGFSLLKEYRTFKFKIFLNKIFLKSNFDLIFSRTIATSVCSHRGLLNSKFKSNSVLLFYFNDPVPFSIMPFPYSNGSSFNPKFDRREKNIVKNILVNSDFVGSPSKLLNEYLFKIYNISNKPNFVFPHLFLYNDVNSNLIGDYLSSDKINITHCGSLLAGRDPFYLIMAIKRLLDLDITLRNKIVLNFFGPSEQYKKFFLENKFEFINVVNKRFSHDESISLMYNSDLPVLLEANSEESPFMPVKLAELIGLGRPFLALSSKNSETRRILGEDYLLQSEPNNSEKIFSILSSFIYNKLNLDQIEFHISNIQNYVSPYFINLSLKKILNELPK